MSEQLAELRREQERLTYAIIRQEQQEACKHQNLEYQPGVALCQDVCLDCGKTWTF